MNTPAANTPHMSALFPYLDRQQNQLDSIENQLEKLTDVITRIALLEERRAQDRQAVEKLDQRTSELEKDAKTKHPQYDDMLESYKQFKKTIIGFVCTGILAAILAVSTGTIKIGAQVAPSVGTINKAVGAQ